MNKTLIDKKFIFLLLIFILFTISCIRIHDKDKYVDFINKEMMSEKRIMINGYYYYEFEGEYHGFKKDIRQFYPFFLYKDGTAYFGWSCRETKSTLNYEKDIFSIYSRHKYFTDFIKKDTLHQKSPFGWGHYKIQKDSIFIKFYSRGPYNPDSYILYELDGQIINDSTFVITKSSKGKKYFNFYVPMIYKFIQYGFKPDSTNVLKKRFKSKK